MENNQVTKNQKQLQKQQKYGFQNKRQQFTVEIRRRNREQLFQRKRAHQQQKKSPDQMPQYQKLDNLPQQTSFITNMDLIRNQIADARFEKQIREFRKQKFNLDMLQNLRKCLVSSDILQNHYGVIGVRKIMSSSNDPPIQAIIEANITPVLINYLKQQNYPHLQLQASWSLSNVASGNFEQCSLIIKQGCIPIFIKLLNSRIYGIVEQAVWAIGNIACNDVQSRDQILSMGGIQLIIRAINQAKTPYMIQHGAWSLSNLCRGKKLPKYQIVVSGVYALAVLIAQNRIRDRQILADCCWAISYHIKNQYQKIQLVLDSNLHIKIPQLLKIDDLAIVLPVLRITGRVTIGTDNQIRALMENGQIINILVNKLSHPKLVIRAQACWVLSNIAASFVDYSERLMNDDNLINILLNLLESDGIQVRTQICHMLANFTIQCQSNKLLQFYLNYDIINHLIMQFSNENQKYVKSIICDLYSMLAFGECFRQNGNKNPIVTEIVKCHGSQIFEQIQEKGDMELYQQITHMIQSFFEIQNSEMITQ